MPHIQGLRALAVTMVLLFHFKLLGATGGFAGVDIFLVLSGYLITTMLVNRSEKPFWHSLKTFYVKRLRRIVPAYFVVLVLVLIIGWFILLPLDYVNLGNSTAAASLFFSNYFFQQEDGYFATASVFKPLLHTWSLSLEIQFYLIWPLGFALVQKTAHRFQALLLAIVILVSFIAACALSNKDASFTFYSLPTRIWEFGIGALLANNWAREKLTTPIFSNSIIAWASVLALVASTFFLDESMLWPGPWAIIPVLATAILLLGGMSPDSRNLIIFRFLSSAPMVWVGAISYSLYLVHWPVVSFIYVYWWPEPNALIRVLVLAICIPLAWGLYRIVEQPLQSSRNRRSSMSTSNFGLVGSCVIILSAGLGLSKTDGLTSRYPDDLKNLLVGKHKLSKLPEAEAKCLLPNSNCTPPEASNGYLYLWGDSHARQFANSVRILAREANYQTLVTANGGCPPLPNAARSDGWYSLKTRCLKANQKAMETILEDPRIKLVVLAARWSFHMEGTRFGSETGSRTYVVRSNSDELSTMASKEVMTEELNFALEAFFKAKKRVFIIVQVPEFNNDAQRCFIMAKVNTKTTNHCDVSRAEFDTRQADYRAMIYSLANKWDNVSVIDLNEPLCGVEICKITLDGELAFKDNNHLLPGAAWKLLSAQKAKLFGL